jgi:hypothetical protein
LHTPLQLQQFDLEIDRRTEVRLLLLEASKLRDLARLGSLRG